MTISAASGGTQSRFDPQSGPATHQVPGSSILSQFRATMRVFSRALLLPVLLVLRVLLVLLVSIA